MMGPSANSSERLDRPKRFWTGAMGGSAPQAGRGRPSRTAPRSVGPLPHNRSVSSSLSASGSSTATPSAGPTTFLTLESQLRSLGLAAGDVVLVHCALSRLGWVCGGAVAVLRAILRVLGPTGTVLVPTHTAELSDPATWRNPPVPQSWWVTIRQTMPAFDPRVTPSLAMGALAELVRTWPDARRSDHPQFSFAAVGPAAHQLTADHRLDDGCGEGSPLARLYELNGRVLLLGVGHDSNTSLHLAEYRGRVRHPVQQTAPVLVDGAAQWVTWQDIDLYSEDFPELGEALEDTGAVTVGPVGQGVGRLMHQPTAVDFAERWLPAQTARPLSQ